MQKLYQIFTKYQFCLHTTVTVFDECIRVQFIVLMLDINMLPNYEKPPDCKYALRHSTVINKSASKTATVVRKFFGFHNSFSSQRRSNTNISL